MSTTLDVDDIASDADLASAIGGSAKLNRAMPSSTERDAIRAKALLDLLEDLKMRSPPVYDTNLSDPTELKDAVVYRSLVLITRFATAVPGDTWHVLGMAFDKDYQRASKRLYTLTDGLVAPGGLTLVLERR